MNAKGDTSGVSTNIKIIVKEYHKWAYSYKFKFLDDVKIFWKSKTYQNWDKKKKENLVSFNKIEVLIVNLPTKKKISGTRWLQW